MRALTVTKNIFLGQKIALCLADMAEITVSDRAVPGYDLYIIDIDSAEPVNTDGLTGKTVTASRTKECDLPLPCTFDSLRGLITDGAARSAILALAPRRAYLRGEEIKLTELEFALLKRLYDAGGEFVSRETLLSDVWHGDAEAGIINVYIHYLREKLERGEKIILSSRSLGYKIDEKYLK